MDHHKRICADEDIISNFSDHLIDLVLNRLPIKDAVRTSILSKRWRYRWTTMTSLILFDEFSKDFLNIGAYDHNGFITIVNQIMIHHKGPILKFLLHIPNIVLNSFQEVNQWMLILSRNSVTQLVIRNSYQIYQIPSSVFSCLELRKLALYGCMFNPPLEFQGFPNLENIFLNGVDFGGSLDGNVINLPQLKILTLIKCVNVKNFNITAINLQILRVGNCLDAMLLQLLHSKHLYVVRILFMKSVKDFVPTERFSLDTMLSRLHKLECFNIDGYFLKFLASEKFPKRLSRAVTRLKNLQLFRFSFGDLDQVQSALCMLQNSPKLKVLHVTLKQMTRRADLELTSGYLESPECLNLTLLKLQTVEMTYFEGSKPELLFVKLLLDHSPHLENMIIRPNAKTDAKKKLKIAKDVMMFPRASTKAKLVYLDQQP